MALRVVPQPTGRSWSSLPPVVLRWRALLLVVALLGGLGFLYDRSAVAVRVTIDGRTTTVVTHAGTVADLLVEHAVPVLPGDLVTPGPGARIGSGSHVVVARAHAARVRADGRVVRLRTHGRSISALLREAAVALGAGDVVTVNGRPWPADRALPTGSPVAAGIAGDLAPPPAALGLLGLARTARAAELAEPGPPEDIAGAPDPGTPGGSPSGPGAPGDAQRDAGAPTDAAPDAGSTAAQPSAAAGEWVVDVWRAVSVMVVESGVPFELPLAGATVGEALVAAGIAVYPEDELWPPADARLDGVRRVVIERAIPFLVETDAGMREVRALARTVGEGLDRLGLGLVGHDYAIPAGDTPLTPGLPVQVVRVKEDILVQEVEIPFATETQADAGMPLDQTAVLRPGVPGLKTQRIRITYENGEETNREVIDEQVLREPTAELLAYGTEIVWNTVDTPEGPKRYWRKLRAYATSYSLSRSGTSPSAPWYGRTRTGMQMRRGIVAVDPRVIGLWTNLYVPGYGVGIAGDTGGGVRRYHVDLGYDDDNYESWHWYVDVYLIEPLPSDDQIRWILP